MRWRLSAIVLALSLWPFLTVQGQKESSLVGLFVPGELLVRFKTDTSKNAADQVHSALGANLVKAFDVVPNLQHVRLPAHLSVPEAVQLYKKNPNVLYAEPNYIRRITQQALLTPNDSQFSQLWGLHNTGQTGGTPDADIDAPEAWDLSTGSSSVVVAVIDTGVDYNHPDLAANMWRNAHDCDSDNIDDDGNGYRDDCYGIDTANNDSNPMDDNNHGTHVAGTIGARGNNSVGVVGVNWNVQIMACKFLNANGSGTDADAIECLQYVKRMKERGVNIIATNNSWGGGGYSQALYDAIVENMNAGILFIAAAGNESANNDSTESYPANYYLPNIISVAATTHTDSLASFSNFGRRTVHVGAPGESIRSTTRNNTYSTYSGTSMAAPHVTGLAALLKAYNPSLDWIALRNLILAAGDPKASLQAKTITGRRINAYQALSCVNAPVFAVLKPGPIVSGGTPVTIAVLHINCASPAGALSVTITPGGQTIFLEDNGISPDLVANDGIYSGTWTPNGLCALGPYTLDFSNGHSLTVQLGGTAGSYSCSSAALSWRTITGTNLNLGDDSVATITSPFPVRFGTASYNSLRIGTNGAISFHQTTISHNNESLPTSSFTTLVAPFWDDLYATGTHNVYWGVLGTAPTRELVIEWRDVRHYNCRSDSSATVRFQVVFFENNNQVLFNYLDTVFGGSCAGQDRGSSATIGVQVTSSDATQVGFNAPILNDGLAVLWSTAPVATADLVLTKSDTPDPVAAGNALTYTLTVTNNGPETASGVTLSDPLPSGVTFVSATSSQGSCTHAGGTVTCALGTLPNGATASVTLTVTAHTAGTLTNTASVTSEAFDPQIDNNSASASTTVTGTSCTGLTATSSPASVRYTPTATRPSRKTIYVTFRNTTGAPQTITSIAPQPGEPFTIVRTSPALPYTLNAGRSLKLSVLTERAAGLGAATATRPYFTIETSCGTLTSAAEPRLLQPLQLGGTLLQIEHTGEQLRVAALGEDVTALRVRLYDLSGRVLIDQASRAPVLAIPLVQRSGKPLANGIYLYVLTVESSQGTQTRLQKLVLWR
ncbi:MAG: S8 family serine peptidase [Candidatus Bipolaricaulota bacterium]|nr:S8 family serine peptidase [Candidatus Bipolaricaulota bacterium]MDW8031342.1 S8 family serine peptidase [Candidatus Bipolaricaulota bacterium]